MIINPQNGIISRRWPIAIKNYWFGQRPDPDAPPDIARLHGIAMPISGARNVKSWTLLTDLSEADTEVMSCLSKSTRTQARRAEREGIMSERLNTSDPKTLDDFDLFFKRFAISKSDVQYKLNISIQLHMLKRLASASMLDISRALTPDGDPIVYHVFIVADGRARVHHSASLFREGKTSAHRHFMAWADRYLHWCDMLFYKQQGYSVYDMGGWYAGKEDEFLLRVNQFKEEFGGKVACKYDNIYGCSFLRKMALWIHDRFPPRVD